MLRPSREIAFPFHIGPDGGIAFVENPSQIHFQHLVQLILTRPGERVMLPGFGSSASDMLFENISSVTAVEMATRLEAAIATWEPAVIVHSVTPVPHQEASVLAVSVQFSVPPREEILSTVVEVGGATRGELNG